MCLLAAKLFYLHTTSQTRAHTLFFNTTQLAPPYKQQIIAAEHKTIRRLQTLASTKSRAIIAIKNSKQTQQ
jgi:16S rRNA G966 N2-methylase RsmD